MAGKVSDWDVVGFCIPSKEEIFPHLTGNIPGFGKQKKPFATWDKHHIEYKDKEYDITIYSIVQFFDLCLGMNPNMVDLLFVPINCVLHSTAIGNLVRDNRHMFLSKLCWHKFKGYAYSQLNKAQNRSHKLLDDVETFEDKHGIYRKTSYNDVLEEIKKRGLDTKLKK